jgi:hypothetical protein
MLKKQKGQQVETEARQQAYIGTLHGHFMHIVANENS